MRYRELTSQGKVQSFGRRLENTRTICPTPHAVIFPRRLVVKPRAEKVNSACLTERICQAALCGLRDMQHPILSYSAMNGRIFLKLLWTPSRRPRAPLLSRVPSPHQQPSKVRRSIAKARPARFPYNPCPAHPNQSETTVDSSPA